MDLTPKEFSLLILLARNAGKVLTHRTILRPGVEPGRTETHSCASTSAQLRRKLQAEGATCPRLLTTEPSVGYRMLKDPAG